MLEKEIAGEYNTFRVYLFMLRSKRASPTQVQKGLAFSSPNLAQHHLEKLIRFSLVDKSYDGTYTVIPKSFGVLRFYSRTGRWIVPRTVFSAIAFGILALGFTIFVPEHRFFWVALAISLVGFAFSAWQTLQFYKLLRK